LVFTVPAPIAEAYGAALVELGAAAVEERAPATASAATGEARFEDNATTDSQCTVNTDWHGNAYPAAAAEVVVTLPEDEPVAAWQELGRKLFEAFAEQLTLPLTAFSVCTQAVDTDYHAGWLDQLAPQALTDDLWFVPTTCAEPMDTRVRQLRFKPEPCFGDGSHATTRLASRATAAFCRKHPGCCVLDVGTGNGVLSLVAVASGAASALGLDLDPTAVAAAEANARLNGVTEQCQFSDADVASLDTVFDLVLANLEPRVQLELMVPMTRRLRAGGTLLMTGFLAEQADWMRRVATAAGLLEIALEPTSLQPESDPALARLAQQLDPPQRGAAVSTNDSTARDLAFAATDGAEAGFVLLAWTRPLERHPEREPG
jgi:ribosomal protein L11 methylase PrmA